MKFSIHRIDSRIADAFDPMLPAECKNISEGDLLIGAVTEEMEPAGVLFAKLDVTGFELRFIYVLPDFRRQGAAGQMLSVFISSMLYLTPIPPVYALFTREEESFGFERLLESSGCFYMDDREQVYVFSSKDRKRSKAYTSFISRSNPAMLYFETDEHDQRNFLKKMVAGGHACVPALEAGIYSRDLSMCHYDEEKGITAAVFFTQSSEDKIELSYAYADEDDSLGFGICLSGGLLEMESLFPKAELEITASDESISDMIKRLSLGNYRIKQVVLARWNYEMAVSEL